MRVVDWSSDVFSSDLANAWRVIARMRQNERFLDHRGCWRTGTARNLVGCGDVTTSIGGQLLERLALACALEQSLGLGFASLLRTLQSHRALGLGTHRGERLGLCGNMRSEEHTSELQSLMRISYAVFCL